MSAHGVRGDDRAAGRRHLDHKCHAEYCRRQHARYREGRDRPGATLDGVTLSATAAAARSCRHHGVRRNDRAAGRRTSITNATLNIAAGSTLDIEKGATGPGATLDGVTVIGNGSSSTIDIGTTASGATIALLDDGTSITNATLNIAAAARWISRRARPAPARRSMAFTVVGNGTSSTIDVGSTTATGVTLTLDNATSITGASWCSPTVRTNIRRNVGATLNDVTVSGGETDVGSTTATA